MSLPEEIINHHILPKLSVRDQVKFRLVDKKNGKRKFNSFMKHLQKEVKSSKERLSSSSMLLSKWRNDPIPKNKLAASFRKCQLDSRTKMHKWLKEEHAKLLELLRGEDIQRQLSESNDYKLRWFAKPERRMFEL